MKGIIATIMMLSLCFSTVISSHGETTAQERRTAQRQDDRVVSLLHNLDILRGNENGDFNLEQKVSRGEFTAFVIRMLGLENLVQETTDAPQTFTDVSPQHWAFGYLHIAKNMELIDGVSPDFFGADRTVRYQEAVKILVSALGYRARAEANGGYPVGYEKMAIHTGLLKRITVFEELSRRDTCQLIYNALTAELFNEVTGFEGKTVLEEHLHFAVIKGVITASGGYQHSIRLEENEMVLDGVRYLCKNTLADDYIGMNVACYVREEGNGVQMVYHIQPIGNDEKVSVSAEDVKEKTSLTRFYYTDQEGREQVLDLAQNPSIFYNGKRLAEGEITEGILKPDAGIITLRDSDGNGTYEVVLIDEYYDYVVHYVNHEVIYGKFNEILNLSATKAEQLSIRKNNESISLKDIQNGDVLSVMQSLDKSITKILVSTENNMGYLSEIENNTEGKDIYSLTGQEGEVITFHLSQSYRQALAKGHIDTVSLKVSRDRKLRVYYNSFGLVADVAVLSDENDYAYGFLNGVKTAGSSINDSVAFQILTTNNRFEVFETIPGEKLTFGQRKGGQYTVSQESPEGVAAALSSKQLVKYKLHQDGKLAEIYKADTVSSSHHFSRGPEAESTLFHYRDNVFGLKYYVDQNTAVFSINRNGDYEHIMSAGKYTTYLNNGAEKYCTFYDLEGSYAKALVMNAPFVVLYDTDINGYEIILDYVNSPVLYIDTITETMGEDGQNYMCLNGFQDGEPYSILVADSLKNNSEARENLKPGIAIQYENNNIYTERALTSDLPRQLILFKTIFDFTAPADPDILWDYKPIASSRAQISTLWGSVKTASENYCAVMIHDESYTAWLHQNTMILRYDSEKRQFTQESTVAMNTNQRVFIRQRYLNTREAVIY